PLLSEYENDTLLNWNNTLTPYPKEKCFHELFEEQVEKTPDAIAVAFEEEKMTYRELNNRANQLAHYLKKQGIGPEVLVGICLERSCEMIIGILGIHKAGGAYVPIDPTYPKDRIAYMLKDSQVSLLLTQQKLLPLFSQLNGNLICLDIQWEEISQESKNNFVSKVTSDNLAYVIYTSGSTGRPKGVMIQHYSLTNYLVWCIKEYDVTRGVGTIVHSSLSFDLTITSIFPSLLVGKEVMLIPESADIEAFGEIIKRSKSLSLLKITPAHLKLLSQQLKPEEFAGKAHTIVIGGEPLFEENIALWRKYAPSTRLINEYGPTETVVGCSTYEISSDVSMSGQVPIGRPISNAQIYILDKNLHPVPVGVKGEIYIGGEGVARGYLNQPELTTEKFIIDSFSGRQGARLYKTGDLARYLGDGNIEFLGRMDDQVKVRGYRIELGEIETLLSQHPVIDSTAVLIQEDKTKDKRLVAYITFKENQMLSSNELREYLKEYLPEYMIPSVFEKLDTMPLTINGKID
ncbi:non-ribosomal peptide synthetase, partial [Bacillus pseudomycoides]